MTNLNSQTPQPTIVKYCQPYWNGLQPLTLTRHSIGFILKGRKKIYNGDVCQEINQGDLFFLGAGNHYIEDVPMDDKPFEQIVFYYNPECLSSILSRLSHNYEIDIQNDHQCTNCIDKSYIIYPGWNAIKNFFSSINQYIKEGIFTDDHAAESIKMMELIYLILTQDNCCLKSKILNNIDPQKEQFELIINKHIFEDISIEKLAIKCNRSLTSFKKEFKKHFFSPPHKWFLRQRLMHSRLLLISTDKSVAEVGIECNFPNTSHFIKLFKKEYEMTPSSYRHSHEYNSKTNYQNHNTEDLRVSQATNI